MRKNPNYDQYVKKLRNALKSLNEEDNPKLHQLIKGMINDTRYETYSDYELAIELDLADLTKSLPKEIVQLMVILYTSAAERDDGNDKGVSYNNLGTLFYNGRAGKRDYEKSIYYYKLADQAGYRLASENIAYCYYYGLGTEVDYERAYYYFSKAAIAGRYEAMYKLGDMFRYGYYVEKDENMVRVAYIKAESMMNQAWETMGTEGINFGSVYMRLGDLYCEGIGMSQDYDKAYECYQRAERGFYEQMRNGSQYNSKDLQYVNNRLAELKRVLNENLPKLDWV